MNQTDMPKLSAGLLLFRKRPELEVFLIHPGGPFWAKKDAGAWSIPKGEYTEAEGAFQAAKREFLEETGFSVDGADGVFLPLGEVKQPGGKRVTAWALEHDLDPSRVKSNSFSMEWPPKSGKLQEFPEVDQAAWFTIPEARGKLLKGQLPLIERLLRSLKATDKSLKED